MAFLTINKDDIVKESGSTYITTSGIYDLTLKHCEIANTKNGAVQANYYTDKVISYGNNLIGVNGKPTFGYTILEALAAVLGEEVLSDPEPTTVTFKTSQKELNCIPELNDVAVKAWVQVSYRMWNGEIRENITMKRFYRAEDGASGSEVLGEGTIGTRLEKDMAVASEVKYEDGLTPEAVSAWKAASQSDSAPKAAAPKKQSNFPGSGTKPAGTAFPGA
jgi:hypothetical protein